jgi:hypothetical protein
MGKNIAKCCNISPGNVGVLGFQQDQIGILETLADDFKIPQNRILGLLVIK